MRLKDFWQAHFEEKIASNFGININQLKHYQAAAAPLIYCCLKNRRITPKERKVISSKQLEGGLWQSDRRWNKLVEEIENGNDINKYLSKMVDNWQAIDSLLFVYGISHLHLRKSNKGGIERELAFGIFDNEHFYAIDIGDHEDLYKPDKLLSIIRQNWPHLSRENIVSTDATYPNNEEFRVYANHPAFQFNLVAPSAGQEGGKSLTLKGHQHTNLISCEIEGIEYEKVPFQAYCAYTNELKLINTIEVLLHHARPGLNLALTIPDDNSHYIVTSSEDESFRYSAPIPNDQVLCSTYNEHI